MRTIQYVYTMEYYSAIKKNEILSFAARWMELENNRLSEISQKQRNKYQTFSNNVEAQTHTKHNLKAW
jgi:hypothetical protein